MTAPLTDAQYSAFGALLTATGWSPGTLAGHLLALGVDPPVAGALAALHAGPPGMVGPSRRGSASAGLFQFRPPGAYTPPPDPAGLLRQAALRYRPSPVWNSIYDGLPHAEFRPGRAAADALDAGNALGSTIAVTPVGSVRYSDGTEVGSRYRDALTRHRDDPNRWDSETRSLLDEAVLDRIARDAAAPYRRAIQQDVTLAARVRSPSDLYRIAPGTNAVTGQPDDRVVYKAASPPPAGLSRLGAAVRAFGRDFARTLRQLGR